MRIKFIFKNFKFKFFLGRFNRVVQDFKTANKRTSENRIPKPKLWNESQKSCAYITILF